jgi:DNA-binding response OmpR family regulator
MGRTVGNPRETPAASVAFGLGSGDAVTVPNRRVLVVDDEPTVRDVVAQYLRRDGHEVVEVGDGDDALSQLADDPPDLVVLDQMLPGTDGLEILRRLRATSDVPVIMLTALAEEGDRVTGLEAGADDYVVKPFSPRELAARVNGVLRRAHNRDDANGGPVAIIEFDGLRIDRSAREVHLRGEPVDFTPKEFDLLAYLATAPRTVFSRADLLREVWQSSPDWQDPATVTVHVRRIRNKIEPDPEHPRWISTVWGVGYRFEP